MGVGVFLGALALAMGGSLVFGTGVAVMTTLLGVAIFNYREM